jgi:hypothetical protein
MGERRARPIIRGSVVLLLCAERGELARASSLLAGDWSSFSVLNPLLTFFSFASINQKMRPVFDPASCS